MFYKDTLYNMLCDNADTHIYPFHMPGHKRNTRLMPEINPYAIDITEIDGFDDLHHARGCIENAQKKAAKLFGAEETHFLINGCTGGILAAVSACTKQGDTVLLARNSHRSVYSALLINRLKPVYIWPKNGECKIAEGITAGQVKEALKNNSDISCVFITSPTYEGVVSDIAGIAEAVHAYNIPLIVDEAHGAHMGFSDIFPESAVRLGADIVIHGIHKTLPSFTQTALVHVQGAIVDRDRLKKYLSVYQSSSPSYILMGSIDYAVTYLCHEGVRKYNEYRDRLIRLYQRLLGLQNIYVLPYGKSRDASKIVVCTDKTQMTGHECYNILREKYMLQPEMSSLHYVILMTSVCDSDEGFERLYSALCEIDQDAVPCEEEASDAAFMLPCKIAMLPYEAEEKASESIRISESCGRISSEMFYVYPPGIPIVVPGERITEEVLAIIRQYSDFGYEFQGMNDINGEYIRVCKDFDMAEV